MTSLLLDLQHLDTSGDELRARRAGLPQRGLLLQRESAMAELAREAAEASDRHTKLARQEREAAGRVADIAARAREVEATLYSGKVKVIRELEALQAELRECQRVRSEREDEQLLVMEQQERVNEAIAAMDAQREEWTTEVAELRAQIQAAERQIDDEIAQLLSERSALTPSIPPAVLAVYEKLRSHPRLRGKVAVKVVGAVCGGCNTTLPTVLQSRLQRESSDHALQCLGCQRILVA